MIGRENLPKTGAPIADENGMVTHPWARFFERLFRDPPDYSAVVVGASPYTYTAPSDGYVVVHGGTVGFIAIQRRNFGVTTGTTSGQFVLKRGDQLYVEYTVVPVIDFFPD